MPERHILVVAVDGLRASALGAYGNTAYPTPALDELAAESFLLDSCDAPAAELAAVHRALWRSVHPLRTDEYAASAVSLPRLLTARAYLSSLVTDSAEVASLGTAFGFDDCIQVAGDADGRAKDVSQTGLARLIAEACDVAITPHRGSRLLWIHARGMYGPWDAPIELQQTMLDEGDPPPVTVVTPPDLSISEADGPDAVFRYGVAYAAQVMVLDACWAALGDSLAASGRSGEWLIMLLGVRGYPLGEHGRVGGLDARLYAEQLHVPWLIRFPDGAGRLARSSRLVSSLDVLPTLVEWIDGGERRGGDRWDGASVLPLVRSAKSPGRDALLCGGIATGYRAIRTPAWSLRYEASAGTTGSGHGPELFVRPDDRWEANDVAALCPDIVEALSVAGEGMAGRIQAGEAMPTPSFAKELRTPLG